MLENTKNSLENSFKPQPVLAEVVAEVLIVACTESTHHLEKALTEEGFSCRVLRQQATAEQKEFSRSYLCLLNHCNAWQEAVNHEKPTLIVEADFVPVRGMGQLPLSFPIEDANLGIAWLYTCAPQIYSISHQGYAQGFSTAMVAYLLSPKGAKVLIQFTQQVTETKGPKAYSTWDSDVDGVLRSHQLRNYVPFRNYGEHGGIPNPEHSRNNLGSPHQADVLYGKLAFLPLYATQKTGHSYLNFLKRRSFARCKGLVRLLQGRFLRWKILRNSKVPLRLLKFALLRQFTHHL